MISMPLPGLPRAGEQGTNPARRFSCLDHIAMDHRRLQTSRVPAKFHGPFAAAHLRKTDQMNNPGIMTRCDVLDVAERRMDELESATAVLIRIFKQVFATSCRTRLLGGADEPLYQPAAVAEEHHRIFFTRDYFASALHEVAHWCIAGAERRELVDYGYWYAPDGRTAEQQRVFESVEVKPQALEWIFSRAAGVRFRLSADNLASGALPSETFRRAVWQQARQYCRDGLPERAGRFAQALASHFGVEHPFAAEAYRLEDI